MNDALVEDIIASELIQQKGKVDAERHAAYEEAEALMRELSNLAVMHSTKGILVAVFELAGSILGQRSREP